MAHDEGNHRPEARKFDQIILGNRKIPIQHKKPESSTCMLLPRFAKNGILFFFPLIYANRKPG
jgi:hypothetical protein